MKMINITAKNGMTQSINPLAIESFSSFLVQDDHVHYVLTFASHPENYMTCISPVQRDGSQQSDEEFIKAARDSITNAWHEANKRK